ncbi:MAG: hypothetical protein AAFV09_15080 [Pseudomonadota bacterium]
MFEFANMIGLMGAAVYASAYLMVQLDQLDGNSPLFSLTQLLAACLVLFSLTYHFNVASIATQIFFITASIVGLVRKTSSRVNTMDQPSPRSMAVSPPAALSDMRPPL